MRVRHRTLCWPRAHGNLAELHTVSNTAGKGMLRITVREAKGLPVKNLGQAPSAFVRYAPSY
jgi:hypothetical protein